MKPKARKAVRSRASKPKSIGRVGAKKAASERRFTRNSNRGGAPKVGGTVHLNREQFNARHSHCITVQMVYADVERSLVPHLSYGLGVPHKVPGNEHVPDMKAVCEHPEDGMCGQNPTDEQLEWINAKLAGKKLEVIGDEVSNGYESKNDGAVLVSEPVSVAVQNGSADSKPKFKFRLGGDNGS